MDHFLELANTDGVIDAIKLVVKQADDPDSYTQPSGRAQAHKELAKKLLQTHGFLKEENASIWTAELVRAFYQSPPFAACVWVNLRYGTAALEQLAGYVLRDQTCLQWSCLDLGKLQPKDEVRNYLDKPQETVREYAARLALSPGTVDTLCRLTGVLPRPPALILAVLDETDAPPAEYDEQIQKLLALPLDGLREKLQNVAVPFSLVLHDELEQIAATRGLVHRVKRTKPVQRADAPFRRALDMDLLGLAFSGGGIRSATFNLGVLQALSSAGLLRQCDYLSTVSGGGYIGSWLAAWIRRESFAVDSPTGPSSAMGEIERRLSPTRTPNPMDERVRPIRFLREYSNYLTPRSGFFSADTWTMIGIYLRNALLNQVIIVSLFGAALLGPRLAMSLTRLGLVRSWVVAVLWAFGAFVLILNLNQLRPPRALLAQSPAGGSRRRIQKFSTWVDRPIADVARVRTLLGRPEAIHIGVVLPWLIAVALTVAAIDRWPAIDQDIVALATRAGRIVFWSLFVILIAGRADRCWRMAGTMRGSGTWWAGKTKALLATLLAAAVSGIVGFALTWVVATAVFALADAAGGLRWHALALGTAGLLSVLSLSIVAMLGMLGQTFPDEHREWWSRFRTVIHLWAIAWLAGFLVSVYVPWALHWVSNSTDYSWHAVMTALLGWIGSTWFGVQKGRTAEDDNKQEHESSASAAGWSAAAMRLAAQAAPFIFIIGLVVGLSIIIHLVLMAQYGSPAPADYWGFVLLVSTGGHWRWILIAAVALLGVGMLFSWRVDINDFSLHHFYKNRLVRCYLGASHTRDRMADWFTGFDPRDDVRLSDFDHAHGDSEKRPKYPGPYPILNCALNLVGGQDLAWQERKSTSFVFTPKYCGYDVDRAVLTKTHDPTPLADPKKTEGSANKTEGSPSKTEGSATWAVVKRGVRRLIKRPRLHEDAFVPTAQYYEPGEGPMLGMAMAISGAAANPNMGRASSPALAFLMTVFNVRLGWWVGNPRETGGVTKPSPRIGLPYTAVELFGAADDRKRYVNLSDGGHFENLGVYELIRRCCRYIIVCDAGQDPRFLAEDLGNLIRQCRTDFGVEIEIDIDRICDRNSDRLSKDHCVVGRIHYLNYPQRRPSGGLMNEEGAPLLPGSRPAHEIGYLAYLKPSMTGDEAQDVLEYFRRVPDFPHQTTADQWFDESQFESYRKLGMHVGQEAFGRFQDDDSKPLGDIDQLFSRLHMHWHRPSEVISSNSTTHVQEYTRILEVIRTNPALHPLDPALFDGAQDPAEEVDPRDEFYICNALIQLIENVYADLELEHQWNHPHVQGWMNVFVHWAQQPPFRRTWRKAEWTYADRFRNFYNDRLRGRALALPRAFVASHRGRGVVPAHPENTIDAFNEAVRMGANVIELDVRRTADGQLIVYHDPQLGKDDIAALTLAEVRARLPHVPTLFECAKELWDLVQLDVELKDEGIEQAVIKQLLAEPYPWRRRDFVLTSFHRSMLKAARACDRHVRTGLLVYDQDEFKAALHDFVELRTDFLGPAHTLVDTEVPKDASEADRARARLAGKMLEMAVKENVPLVPWSDSEDSADSKLREAKDARLARLLCHRAVAGIITDDVAGAREVKRTL